MIPRLVLASLRRRPRQLALIVAAVLVAAATVATLAGFSARAGMRLAARLAEFGPNLVVRPEVGGPPALPAAAASRIAAIPGVLAVTAVPTPRSAAAGAVAVQPAGPGAAVRLDVRAQPARLAEIARRIEARVEGVEATPLLKTSDSDARLIHRLSLVLLAVSGMSLLLALLSVGAATAALVGERRVEVGLMLALGLSGRRIGGLLAAELLTAALAAALAGEVLGELAAGGLERHLLGGGGGLQLTWSGMAAAAAVAVLVVGASLVVALRRIEHLDPARVLRGE
jgi:putative ABC transport system permease protein